MAKKAKKRKKKQKAADRSKPLSEMQQKKLIAYVRDKATAARMHGNMRAIIDELIVDLLLEAGLKPGELCDLCLEDTPAFRADKSIAVRSERGHKARAIPISQETADRIRRFTALYRQGAQSGDPLILSERGNPLGYFSIYSKIRRIGQGAGLKHLQPNTLRKTYISKLFAQEQDLRLVQIQAGHSSHKTTALYVEQIVPQPQHRPKRAPRKRCEACGKRVSINRIAQIDSGQVLCKACLTELRG